MTITPHLFEAYLKCPTKCFLRSLGETGAGNAYADWVFAQNTFYQREASRRLQEGVANDECAIGPLDRKELNSATWRIATEIKVYAQNLECTLHAVERLPSDTPDTPAQFTPTRFIFTNKLGRYDKLLLAFDTLVLSETLGREVALGKIIHGDDFVTLKVKTFARKKPSKEVRDLIFQMVAPEPDLGSASHSRGFSYGGNRRPPHTTQQRSQGERRPLRAGDGRECHARI
jgi:hypothetical protein